MNHFDNPSIIRLTQFRDIFGSSAGEFVTVNAKDTENLGPRIVAKILDIRSVVVLFSNSTVYGRQALSYYGPNTTKYKEAMDDVQRAGTRHNTVGCYGFQVAVEIGGKKYILPCCSSAARRLRPTFKMNLGKTVMIVAEKVENQDVAWYAMDIWVKASTVQSYIPRHEGGWIESDFYYPS